MAFLDNCKGFLLYTLPFGLLTFLPIWKLYWLFKHRKVAALICNFSSLAYLAISLICDNGQYLAFRSFEQLRSFHPINHMNLISQVLAIFALFSSVFCSFGLLLITHKLACKLFRPPTLLRAIPSYKFFGIWTATRFLAGFIHATIDDPLDRILLLLALQFIMVLSTALSWPLSRFKSPHTVLMAGQVARLALYLLAVLEVVFPELAGSIDMDGRISSVSNFLIQVMFFSSVLQIFLTFCVGILV